MATSSRWRPVSPEQLGRFPVSRQARMSFTCPTPALQIRCGRGKMWRTGVGAAPLTAGALRHSSNS